MYIKKTAADALAKIQQTTALVKTIPSEIGPQANTDNTWQKNWDYLLKQLSDPVNNRPIKYSNSSNNPDVADDPYYININWRKRRLNFNTQNWDDRPIDTYIHTQRGHAKPNATHIKATSTTLLPSNGVMKLFPNQYDICLLFDLNLCQTTEKIFRSNASTNCKWWINNSPWSNTNPNAYAPLTNLQDLKTFINSSQTILNWNEVFAKTCKEALLAVVIPCVGNSRQQFMADRLSALHKKFLVRQILDIDLPILFLTDNGPVEYTQTQQLEDILTVSTSNDTSQTIRNQWFAEIRKFNPATNAQPSSAPSSTPDFLSSWFSDMLASYIATPNIINVPANLTDFSTFISNFNITPSNTDLANIITETMKFYSKNNFLFPDIFKTLQNKFGTIQLGNIPTPSSNNGLNSLQCLQVCCTALQKHYTNWLAQHNLTKLIDSSPIDFLATKQEMRKKAREPKCFEFKLTVIEELRTYQKAHPDPTSTAQILSLLQEIYFIPDNPDIFITSTFLWSKIENFARTATTNNELKTTCTRIVELLQSQFTSLFIQSNGDLTKTYTADNTNLTILEYFATYANWNMLRVIAETEKYKPTKDDPTKFGKALLIAINNEKSPCPPDIYKLLTQEHTSLTVSDKQGLMVIHHAIKKKDAGLLRLILDQKNIAQILSTGTNQTTNETIIHFCILYGSLYILKQIIDKLKVTDKGYLQNVLQTKMDYNGKKYTPIELAAALGKWDMVSTIAENSAPTQGDLEGFGNTLLALINDEKKSCPSALHRLLIQEHTALTIADSQSFTVIHHAIKNNDEELLQLTLSHKNSAQILSTGTHQTTNKTIIHFCIQYGSPQMLQKILEHKSSTQILSDCMDKPRNETIIHFCLLYGSLYMLKQIIDKLKETDKSYLQNVLQTKMDYNGKKCTPIELAAALGKWDMVSTIAENCTPTQGDPEGFGNALLTLINDKKTPLPSGIYKLLIKEHTSLTIVDNQGFTVSQHAIKNDDEELLQLILDQKNIAQILSAGTNKTTNETIIHFCIIYGSSKILKKITSANNEFVRQCLTQKMTIATTNSKVNNYTPMQLAAVNGKWKIVLTIAKNYKPTDDPDGFNLALLLTAKNNIPSNIYASLIIADSTTLYSEDDPEQKTALHYAIINRNDDLLQRLLDIKNFVQSLFTYQNPTTQENIVHFCIKYGSPQMLQKIIDKIIATEKNSLQKLLQTKVDYTERTYTAIELAAERHEWDMAGIIAEKCELTTDVSEKFGKIILTIVKKSIITDKEKAVFKLLLKKQMDT